MGTWDTVPTARTVLFVVHNGTTLDRLLDVAAVFADDLRVRIVVTSDLSDPFAESLPEQVATVGLAAVPWATARTQRYDLIVAARTKAAFNEATDRSSTVLITSTWGNGSLLGMSPGVVPAVVDAGYDTRLVLPPGRGGRPLRPRRPDRRPARKGRRPPRTGRRGHHRPG
jgi:hypothetical protein